MRNRLALGLAAVLWAVPAPAQVEVAPLEDARALESGILDIGTGGLDRALWQNTSAEVATRLIRRLPLDPGHPIARELVHAALVSTGTPPTGSEDAVAAWRKARADYLIASGDAHLLARLQDRSTDVAASGPRVDLALAQGDVAEACLIADGVRVDRTAPRWATVRAFCHATRDEIAAAELTAELLAASGYDNPEFTQLLAALTRGTPADPPVATTPLIRAMARQAGVLPDPRAALGDPDASASARLGAVWAGMDVLDGAVLEAEMAALADMAELSPAAFVYEDNFEDDGPQGTARLFVLATQMRDPSAAVEVLRRADAAGAFAPTARRLAPVLATMDTRQLSDAGLDMAARACVVRGDLGQLQGLYAALTPDTDDRARLALIADALGGGFAGGGVGVDVDRRLGDPDPDVRRAAARDTAVAVALGADLSERATLALAGLDEAVRLDVYDRVGLDAAIAQGSRAEVALRVTELLGPSATGDGVDTARLYEALRVLQSGGLSRFAARLAAYDYASRL